ncbi:MAG: hypothetical protein Edafosvirus52_5 [Edafosvirus sp.]|uniref:Uncharacterized protein n=1 Tax=Edafosvirus sp. TaxID=2487765 RepID=A0A3G4ZY40_9VIRU|nr:MAG: hypothetical protein Edafosvirus52_5 [Edafosvirus sp.]
MSGHVVLHMLTEFVGFLLHAYKVSRKVYVIVHPMLAIASTHSCCCSLIRHCDDSQTYLQGLHPPHFVHPKIRH